MYVAGYNASTRSRQKHTHKSIQPWHLNVTIVSGLFLTISKLRCTLIFVKLVVIASEDKMRELTSTNYINWLLCIIYLSIFHLNHRYFNASLLHFCWSRFQIDVKTSCNLSNSQAYFIIFCKNRVWYCCLASIITWRWIRRWTSSQDTSLTFWDQVSFTELQLKWWQWVNMFIKYFAQI